VKDASRSVQVCRDLMDAKAKKNMVEKTKQMYLKIREEYASRQHQKRLLSLAEARERKFKTDWSQMKIATPVVMGIHALPDFDLNDIRTRIDWTPFFITWELKGKFPKILDDPKLGLEATKLYQDANAMLDEIITKRLLKANGVMGFYPANSVGDDIEVYADEKRLKVLKVFHTIREQVEKREAHQPYYALADFIAPKESGVKDYIGAFAVTAGVGLEHLVKQYEQDHDDYKSIMAKALADRLAEAFAERLHELVRTQYWGYSPREVFTNEDLIDCQYQGIRPAPGYPACPDHTEKPFLFDLLNASKHTGITLTESFAMLPAASVCGLYFSHPQSRYFWIDKIGKDQAEDLAKRKNVDVSYVEKWLSPVLGL
jgi:5-methyltetrahydrofolate--homocysteine methyltransferase